MMGHRSSAARPDLANAAAKYIGVPFRLHGRHAEYGLDCIGLVSAALSEVGVVAKPPRGYRLRNADISHWLEAANASGLEPTIEPMEAGDVILTRPGPGQDHLLIFEGARSFVHAHAGLGKVCRIEAPLPWPIEMRWRLGPRP